MVRSPALPTQNHARTILVPRHGGLRGLRASSHVFLHGGCSRIHHCVQPGQSVSARPVDRSGRRPARLMRMAILSVERNVEPHRNHCLGIDISPSPYAAWLRPWEDQLRATTSTTCLRGFIVQPQQGLAWSTKIIFHIATRTSRTH